MAKNKVVSMKESVLEKIKALKEMVEEKKKASENPKADKDLKKQIK